MLNVESAAFFSSVFTTLFANITAVTIVGYLRSLMSSWLGDDTSEEAGLATLNPLAHIDAFFFISFMIFGIGLGQYPMISQERMTGSYKKIKFVIASFFNTFLYMSFATITLAALLIFFGPSILELLRTVTFADASVMRHYPSLSSFSLSLALIGIAIVHINSLLAFFSLIVNLVRLITFSLRTVSFGTSAHKEIWVLFGAILFIYIFFNTLHYATTSIILGTGYMLAYVFGIGA